MVRGGGCEGGGGSRGMTTEKAASKEANLEGQAILAYPDADIRCRRIWQGGKYVAVGPIGHLQPPRQTMALCGRMTCGSEYATSYALRLCRNCVEKAVRSTQRKSEIRADRDALRERNRALVEALTAAQELPKLLGPHYKVTTGSGVERINGRVRAVIRKIDAALAADAKA